MGFRRLGYPVGAMGFVLLSFFGVARRNRM
jgi:hypothetical protein